MWCSCRGRLVERATPARAKALEELRLLVVATERVVRLGPLELLHLEPRVLEELTQIGHRRAPFGGQPRALLPKKRQSTVERRAEMQPPQIEEARRETAADAIGSAADDGRLAAPYGVPAHEQLEPLERAARSDDELRRGARPRSRRRSDRAPEGDPRRRPS